MQAKRQQAPEIDPAGEKVSLVGGAQLDSDIYGQGKYEGYVTSIAANDDLEVRCTALPIYYNNLVHLLNLSFNF